MGDEQAFQEFIDKYDLSFPQVSDDPGEVYTRFGVPQQPALVIIDADGGVQQLFGAVDDELLDSILADAVG